ncbi:hypothetical protein [Streptomyces kaniharaensis]|nr:hypothetical protein [Streptomyces kaniharaensis]
MRHLDNFRVQPVHSPALLRALTRPESGPSRGLWNAEDAEQFAAVHNIPH